MDVDKIYEEVNNLPLEQQMDVVQRLLGDQPGLKVLLGGSNVVANTVAVQFNATSEEISEVIKNVPQEVIAEFLKAVAMRMIQNSHQRNPH